MWSFRILNEKTDQALLNGESDQVCIWKYVVITSQSSENLEPRKLEIGAKPNNFTMEINFSLLSSPLSNFCGTCIWCDIWIGFAVE